MRGTGRDTCEALEAGELVVGLGEVRGAAKEGLLAMSVVVGLKVMAEMMEEELTRRVGPKHAKLDGRLATRHASAPGSVVLGGRKIKVRRPRARTTEGKEVRNSQKLWIGPTR